MQTDINKPIIEIKPDYLPTIEAFGLHITIPTASLNTVLLALLCVVKVKELIESSTKSLNIALTALDRIDISIIDAMDDLAVEMREITNADRVVFFFLHNGVSNTVYHWKRLSAMSEATRVGIKPIIKELREILVPSVLTESDYNLYKSLGADKEFIHVHLHNAIISRKHKNFILDTGMFGHYIRVLKDEDTKQPYGAVVIQYASLEQFDKVWSENTYNTLGTKLDTMYNLLTKRTKSERFRFIAKIRELLRFGK